MGCGGAHLSQLKEAAEADLQCPKSRVHILNSGKTRDVEACGQRATYHWEDGDWRMIARSGPAGGAPGSAGAGRSTGHEVGARRCSGSAGARHDADQHAVAAAGYALAAPAVCPGSR